MKAYDLGTADLRLSKGQCEALSMHSNIRAVIFSAPLRWSATNSNYCRITQCPFYLIFIFQPFISLNNWPISRQKVEETMRVRRHKAPKLQCQITKEL
jgi:uncharacterized membrane protein